MSVAMKCSIVNRRTQVECRHEQQVYIEHRVNSIRSIENSGECILFRSLNSRIFCYRFVLSDPMWILWSLWSHTRDFYVCVQQYVNMLWKNLFARMQTFLLFECIDCRPFNICVFAAGAVWTLNMLIYSKYCLCIHGGMEKQDTNVKNKYMRTTIQAKNSNQREWEREKRE